ncbi:DNA methyltransferase [Vulcanibacillus modesticaldus]|uniref:DNA methyltransferase n=1 Tax=Vulcanibacillus modesticaldus TaxID=337097 RepID=A0A1D2YWV3_9BACI|nr:iron-sulfur cluster assembly protein [Vulcanibacillus modesticaldus]OEG00245.1 DNA methyltransferase [Vulcanibacillus modesticaldus]
MSLSDELNSIAPIKFQGFEDEELKQRIIDELMEVNDPELNVDIINLGLVYEIKMDEEKNIEVIMTLTAMGCPLAGTIKDQVEEALRKIPTINRVRVELVWNPPWNKSRVSKLAALGLGIKLD